MLLLKLLPLWLVLLVFGFRKMTYNTQGVFDLTAGGAVLDTPLMQTREGVAVPDMLNSQCILLQLMHEGSNGRRPGKEVA